MIFTSDLDHPEAPVLLPDRSWLVVEMGLDRGCLTHVSSDGREKHVLAKTGRPNGLAIDRDGIIWLAESMNPPSLVRATLDGRAEVFMTGSDGDPFRWPNDLCFGPDGALYMTDSGPHAGEWARISFEERKNASTDGRLWRIDVAGGTAEILDSGLPFANGIVFGPDRDLYVSGTLSGMVYRYKWHEGGGLEDRVEFGNVIDQTLPPSYRGPDGMAFGTDGNLYVAVAWQGDVAVLAPDGAVVRRIRLDGSSPTNVAFGAPGEKKIYVTEQDTGRIEVFDVDTEGLQLYT